MNFKYQPQAFAPSHSALLFQNSKPGQPQTSAPDQALFCFNISHQNATGRHRFHEPIKCRAKAFMPGHRTRQRSKCKAKMLSPAKHIAPNDKRPDKMTWAMSVLQHRQSSQSPRISILFSYSLHASVSGAKTTSIFCPLSVSDNAYKSRKIALNCLSRATSISSGTYRMFSVSFV